MSEYLNVIQQFSKFQGVAETQIKLLEQKLEELNNKMKKLEEENEKLKESNEKMVGMPDFSKRKILKAYNSSTIPDGIKMEEDGWIAASARCDSYWINLSINGIKILNQGLFWSTPGQHSMFVPVQKNDHVKIESGTHHEMIFYPKKK
jgi:hypothetical protein